MGQATVRASPAAFSCPRPASGACVCGGDTGGFAARSTAKGLFLFSGPGPSLAASSSSSSSSRGSSSSSARATLSGLQRPEGGSDTRLSAVTALAVAGCAAGACQFAGRFGRRGRRRDCGRPAFRLRARGVVLPQHREGGVALAASYEEAAAAYPLPEGEEGWDDDAPSEERAQGASSDWDDEEEDYDDDYEDDYEEAEGAPQNAAPDPDEIIFGDRVPFASLDIKDGALLSVLPRLGFNFSTRVQSAAIPMILAADRRAVVINAETGSGKTLAYMLPAFELAMRLPPRPEGCPCPRAMILVPGRELGFQVEMVAKQLAAAIARAEGGREISVYAARRGWPSRVPDILITTPRAAAQGLAPCGDEDEVARREALDRVRDVELVCFDEADILLGGGSNTADVRTVLVAIGASYPNKPREVLPEAQVYYRGGVPVEVLDEVSLRWKPGRAQWNPDGSFNVRYDPGDWEKYVRRARLRGPGIALHVEHGPHIVMASATLPNFKRSRLFQKEQNNALFNSGIGSPDWVIKRWFPNAVRIESEWIHRRHPCIVKQDWVYINDETKKGSKRNLPLRIKTMVQILKDQDPDIRTLVFANTPDVCLAAEMALKGVKVPCGGIHAARPLDERIESLKQFAKGELSVLVCTDLASRGIDLPVCRHVIQLEFARNPVDHLHRTGRAARAGRLSKTTNFWGDGDVPVRDAIMQAPEMGLSGEILTRTGNRMRLRRIRKKQRKQERNYGEVRQAARLARYRTERKRAKAAAAAREKAMG